MAKEESPEGTGKCKHQEACGAQGEEGDFAVGLGEANAFFS